MLALKILSLIGFIGAAVGSPAASAATNGDPAQYVIASKNVSFDTSDNTNATFTIQLINLTTSNALITAKSTDNAKACSAAPDPGTLQAASEETVKVTLQGCVIPEKGGFLVTLNVGGQPFPPLSVTPASNSSTPDWKLLWAFLWAFLAALLTLIAACVKEYYCSVKHKRHGGWGWFWRDRLNLTASWSLHDSWASNVTVVAAAFAGVFGSSDVLKAVFGNDTTPILGLVTVSSAIAAGIVGAAPLVLADLRFKGDVTPVGLLAGASLTVGAAGGELAVIVLAASRLSLGGVQHVLKPVGLIGGGILLFFYTFRTMTDSLVPKPQRTRTKGAKPVQQPSKVSEAAYQKMQAMAEALPDAYPLEAVAAAYGESLPTLRQTGRRSAVF